MSAKTTAFHRILLVLLFLSFGQWAHAMPPHPDLLKRIKEGAQPVPYFVLNQERLKATGVNQPPERPSLQEKLLQRAPARGPSGNFRALALLVDFSDKTSQVSASYFDTLIFGTGTKTVRDYYHEVSYGTLTIVTVHLPSATGWLRAPSAYSNYVNGQNGFGAYPNNVQKLVEDVVDAANAVIDFSQYDNDANGYVDALYIVHAGPGAEFTGSPDDIWSHKWSITPRLKDGVYVSIYSMEPEYWMRPGDMTIGVYCHELGHVFGLPDLYDYDYSSSGLGEWSLMAGGSWNGYFGDSPAHLDAWCRLNLDFATPTVIAGNTLALAIPAVENDPAAVYYLWECGAPSSEYFLMENRQSIGYDAELPGHGLLIFHIDETAFHNNYECRDHQNCYCPSHYTAALEQADGILNLEYGNNRGDSGDPYPGYFNNRSFSLSTLPNSGSYVDCDSDLAVTNISDSAETMSADISVCNASTINISGYARTSKSAPIPGVAMNGLPSNPAPVTDSIGYYECEAPSGWSGCVSPTRKGFAFTPESRCYENLASSQVNQNYVGLQKPAAPGWIDYPICDADGRYTVCWAKSKRATSYELARSNDGGVTWKKIYTGANTCVGQSAKAGCYLYRVRAVNSAGNSAWKVGTEDCCVPCP